MSLGTDSEPLHVLKRILFRFFRCCFFFLRTVYLKFASFVGCSSVSFDRRLRIVSPRFIFWPFCSKYARSAHCFTRFNARSSRSVFRRPRSRCRSSFCGGAARPGGNVREDGDQREPNAKRASGRPTTICNSQSPANL